MTEAHEILTDMDKIKTVNHFYSKALEDIIETLLNGCNLDMEAMSTLTHSS